MPKHILQVNQPMFETQLDRMVSQKVNEIRGPDAGRFRPTRSPAAARYERSDGRRAYRAGHYERDLTVKAGKMAVRVPKLKGALFESAVIVYFVKLTCTVSSLFLDSFVVHSGRFGLSGFLLVLFGYFISEWVFL
jgi:hypothetical protein